MQSLQTTDQHIQFLITANYQRMLSYEQAAFLTSEPSFKEFYLARADESEVNIKQLCVLLNINHAAESYQADSSFSNLFHGKKTTLKILESVKTIEKTIIKWYKGILKEITDLPKEIVEMIEGQYHLLNNAQVKLGYL